MRRRRTSRIATLLIGSAMMLSMALLSGPIQAQEQLIAFVEVEGTEFISRDVVLDVVKDLLKVGEPFTTEATAQARQALMDMGYFAEVTISHEVTDEGLRVVITVVEKKRIENIVFVGNTVVDDTTLREVIHSKVGHIVDSEVINRDVSRIEEYYSKQGYLATVPPGGVRVDEYGVLTFVIDEARIESFVIEGLEDTKEWIVRRLIETKPGNLFHVESIAKDIQRIVNVLGIFQSVKFDLRRGEIDRTAVIVVIQVEEKRTGMASVAAAYSELDKFVFMFSIAENNFRGRAERISLDVEALGRTSYDVRFYEPFLDGHNTSLDLSVFDTERQRRFLGTGVSLPEEEFSERRTGGSVRLTRPMRSTQRLSLALRSEKVSSSYFQGTRTLGPGGGVGTLSAVGPAQGYWEGGGGGYVPEPSWPPGPGDTGQPVVVAAPLHPGGLVNSTTLEYTWDTRDIIADPNRGSLRNLSWRYAGGFLGGENDFSLYSLEQRKYLPMRAGKDVLAMRLMLGASSGDVPLFDSWSVGGATTLRGYQQDRYRGENLILGTLEYRYHLSKSLGLVAFADAGDAFGGTFPTVVPGFNIPAEDDNLALHVGLGLGLRAKTPLGPIRIDWGIGSEGSEVHFGFGQTF